MTLKLYGMAAATCTQRVLTTLAELGVTDYELIIINVRAGEQKAPSYLANHPFGKIPLLDDDGFLIFESRAICKYLAIKYADKGKNLIPPTSDLKTYGLFEQVSTFLVLMTINSCANRKTGLLHRNELLRRPGIWSLVRALHQAVSDLSQLLYYGIGS